MSLRVILVVFLLSFFSLSMTSCGSSSATDDTSGGTTSTATDSFPEDLSLNISDNLKGEDTQASLSADLLSFVVLKDATIGQTTEYVNEITTAFATTFGSQGQASTEAVESLATNFNAAGFTTGNNCGSNGETEYRCVIAENATFESASYGRVARCYLNDERFIEWYLNNNDTDTNNGVLIAEMEITEDHGGPEDVGDTLRARLDYDLGDADAKSVTHIEAITRDNDATLVSTIITMGLENESAGTVDLEALFYGDFSGSGTPTTNHDLAKHNSATDYTYIVGVAYNNHIEAPGDQDDAECIDSANITVADSNCTGLEVDLADVTVDPDYAQSVTTVNGTSLEFSSNFAATIPSDLASATCTTFSGGGEGGGGGSPSEEDLMSCAAETGVTGPEPTLGEMGEATFVDFCVCIVADFGIGEAECTAAYTDCEPTDTAEACLQDFNS